MAKEMEARQEERDQRQRQRRAQSRLRGQQLRLCTARLTKFEVAVAQFRTQGASHGTWKQLAQDLDAFSDECFRMATGAKCTHATELTTVSADAMDLSNICADLSTATNNSVLDTAQARGGHPDPDPGSHTDSEPQTTVVVRKRNSSKVHKSVPGPRRGRSRKMQKLGLN